MGKGGDSKPKGRMSAYAYFVQTCREEHKKKHPSESVVFAEFSRKCADRWRVRDIFFFFFSSLSYFSSIQSCFSQYTFLFFSFCFFPFLLFIFYLFFIVSLNVDNIFLPFFHSFFILYENIQYFSYVFDSLYNSFCCFIFRQ